jgi:hypothetical protein
MSPVLFVYPADKLNVFKMLFITTVRKIQSDNIQTGSKHFSQDGVAAAGRA